MAGGPSILSIKETCIYVSDLRSTRRFYEDVIGLECFSMADGSHAFFRAGTSVLLCFDPHSSREQDKLPRHFGQGELHFAFEVDREDYPKWLQQLKDRHVPIEHEHVWPGGFRSFYFRDPDRNCVEVIEHGMWEFGQEQK